MHHPRPLQNVPFPTAERLKVNRLTAVAAKGYGGIQGIWGDGRREPAQTFGGAASFKSLYRIRIGEERFTMSE
jgi:hypothetical protein